MLLRPLLYFEGALVLHFLSVLSALMSFGPWDQIRSGSEIRYQGKEDSVAALVKGPLHGFLSLYKVG